MTWTLHCKLMERSGRSYCLCNEMSFSHFQHFCEGIAMTTRSFFLLLFFFCFLYCCCAALFWWLHKQPCTVTSGHINPNSTPPPPPNYLFWNSLENILKFIWWLWFLVKHELDSFVDVRTWDKTNDGKSRNLWLRFLLTCQFYLVCSWRLNSWKSNPCRPHLLT